MIHPFDGFWRLKNEKRGTLGAALIIYAVLFLTTVLRLTTSGFLFQSGNIKRFSAVTLLFALAGAVCLYCVANWSLTTLMDGEGKFSEIFIATAYSLVPLALANLPLTFFSRVITIQESAFYTFFNTVIILWTVFLLLSGCMCIHDYSMTKTVFVELLTVFAMLVIIILLVLFFNLLQQVWIFLLSIWKELTFRL